MIFHPPHCEIQEQDMRRMIGHAKEKGLYFLELQSRQKTRADKLSPMSCMTESLLSHRERIWLQHLRFGHPSFNVLKIMYPLLFKELNGEDFQCDTCEFMSRP